MNDIFITNIRINIVRHLQDINIKLSHEKRMHLILTGKNGSGKTSVLWSMMTLLRNVRYIRSVVKNAAIHFEVNTSLRDLENKANANQLILAYFEAKRDVDIDLPQGPARLDIPHDDEIYRHKGTQLTFLQYLVNLKAEKSFAREDGDMETVEKIGAWFNLFEHTLKDLFEDEHLTLQFDRKNFNFHFITKNRDPFDFNTLADGYSAVIDIISNLIIRMGKKRIMDYNMQGIVLIDEIEAHLHVSLQKKILPFLSKLFPNIQFIITTHSPFVLNSLGSAIVYDLEHQLRIEDMSTYTYETIVEKYFEIDKHAFLVRQKLQDYETLLNIPNRSKEEENKLLTLKTDLEKTPTDFTPTLIPRFQQFGLLKKTQNGKN